MDEHRPRRVLFVLQSVADGGMETHVLDLAVECARRGISVRVCLPAGAEQDGLAARFAGAGIAADRIDTDARRGRIAQLRGIVAFARLLRAIRPDVVHVHTGGATGGAAPVLAARAARARVVISEHDVPSARPGLRQRFARRLLDASCHAVVAVSRRNGALRAERIGGPTERMAVVLNGVPVPELDDERRASDRAAVRTDLGIGADEFVVGSVVRLAEGKGLDDLLAAIAMLQHPAHLLLVGDGPLRDALAVRADALGLAERVVMAGHRADPARFVDAMDLFVLAVPAGSMSIALLEAMARGIAPLITFCGPEEAVVPGVSGYCAPPSDPAGLAAAIDAALADDAARTAIARGARAHVRAHFSVGRVADDMLALYGAARGRMPDRLRLSAPATPFPGPAGRPSDAGNGAAAAAFVDATGDGPGGL